MYRTAANFVGFQVGWIVAVVGAANGYPYLGPVYAVAWLAIHFRYFCDDREQELVVVAAAVFLGLVFDSLGVFAGLLDFPSHARDFTTLWMLSLWAMFAATLRHSMAWLRDRYLLAAVLGGIFGPFAYWAGARLSAIELTWQPVSLLWVMVVWVLALPLLTLIATRRNPDPSGRG